MHDFGKGPNEYRVTQINYKLLVYYLPFILSHNELYTLCMYAVQEMQNGSNLTVFVVTFTTGREDDGPSAIDSESIRPLSVLHSGLKREW